MFHVWRLSIAISLVIWKNGFIHGLPVTKEYTARKDALLAAVSARCGDGVISGRVDNMYWPNMKVTVCKIPKSASTFFEFLEKSDVPKIGQPSPHTTTEVWRSPETFRFMFVRNPWARLYSGYIDKILMPGFYMHDYPMYSLLHLEDCRIPTFREFLDAVVSLEGNIIKMNGHWKPMTWMCDPCHLRPNFIGKVEEFDADLNYLGERLGILPQIQRVYGNMERNRNHFWVGNVLYLHYHLGDKESCKRLPMEVIRRVWLGNKATGSIRQDATFPIDELRPLEPLTEDKSMAIVDIFRKFSQTGKVKKDQYSANLKQAYSEIPSDLKNRLLRMYANDFSFFEYSTSLP